MGGRLLLLLLYCEGVVTGVGGRLLMDNLQGCVGRGHDNSCCI